MATNDLVQANERLKPIRRLLDDIDLAAREAISTEQGVSELKAQKAALAVEVDGLVVKRNDLSVKMQAEEANVARRKAALEADLAEQQRTTSAKIADLSERVRVAEDACDSAVEDARQHAASVQADLDQAILERRNTLAVLDAELTDRRAKLAALLNG